MAINTGVNTSKLVGYGVLAPPGGVSVTKLVSYVVISAAIVPSVSTSKFVAYAVLNATNTNPPVWPSMTLPDGYVGIIYSQSWNLYPPASTPISYSLVSGSLPPGLALTDDGFSIGTISGTPTTAGTYTFTIRATNPYGSADNPLSITIHTSPPVVVSGSYVFLN